MKSLKKLFIMLLAGSVLQMFFACNDIQEEDSSASSDVCTVKISISDETSRAAIPEIELNDLTYTLSILGENSSTAIIKLWDTLEEMRNDSFNLAPGKYTFWLYAYKDKITILSCESVTDIKQGSTSLIFVMKPHIDTECTTPGSFETEIVVDPDATKVTATIYDIKNDRAVTEADLEKCGWTEEEDGKITQVFEKDQNQFETREVKDEDGNPITQYYIKYIIKKIPTGNYMLVYEFEYDDGSGNKTIYKYRTIIVVLPGYHTKDKLDTTEDECYLIYNDNCDGAIFKTTKKKYVSGAKVDLDFDFGRNTEFTLIGWATTPDGKAVYTEKGTQITMESTTTLYAVWKENKVSGATITVSPPKYIDEMDLELVHSDPTESSTSIKFSAKSEFANYLWLVDNEVKQNDSSNEFVWDYSTLEADSYNITVVVTTSDGKSYSAVTSVTINK